jgi:hypothetical protein
MRADAENVRRAAKKILAANEHGLDHFVFNRRPLAFISGQPGFRKHAGQHEKSPRRETP